MVHIFLWVLVYYTYRNNQVHSQNFPLLVMFEACTVIDFKYLGVWLSDNLTWTKHVEQITKRATKQAGLIFRRFYAHSSSESLKQLYVSFVRPHLEYAAPVWDPHCIIHINALERVQKFSLRMSYKAWDEEYDNLLSRANLQPLAKCRKFLKVCYL